MATVALTAGEAAEPASCGGPWTAAGCGRIAGTAAGPARRAVSTRNTAKDTTAIITATPAQRTVGSVTSLPASTVCTLARTHNGNANTCTRRQQRQGNTTRTHEVSTTAVS